LAPPDVTGRQDPRDTVTPDAFRIAPERLGLPLATPRRRAAAIAVDGVFVGLLSLMGWFLLGIFGAAFLLRMAWRRTTGHVVVRAARMSMGCAGMVVLGITVTMGGNVVRDRFTAGGGSDVPAFVGSSVGGLGGGVTPASVLSGIGGALALQGARNEEEAEEAAVEVARSLAGIEALDSSELVMALEGAMSEEASFDTKPLIDRVVAGALAEARAADPVAERAPEGEEASADAAVDAVSLADALTEYAALRRIWSDSTAAQIASGDSTPVPLDPRSDVLALQIVTELGADTLATLNEGIETLDEDLDDERAAVRRAQERVEEAEESSGLFAWLGDTMDELGLAFGWGALYFSFLVAWKNGRTIGKRLFGIRIVRLDGQPISWFLAFERPGGYAAGLATGFLGFLQIFWDPNRQGIHDKIAGTVVVREGRKARPAKPSADSPGEPHTVSPR
jgi:hypothetical protein